MSIISLVIEQWMMLITSNEIKFLVSCCNVSLIKFLVAKNSSFSDLYLLFRTYLFNCSVHARVLTFEAHCRYNAICFSHYLPITCCGTWHIAELSL